MKLKKQLGTVTVFFALSLLLSHIYSIPTYAADKYEFVKAWGSHGSEKGQFNLAHGIAVDASRNVYVADTYNHRIQKFDSDGNFIRMWGRQGQGKGQFDKPMGITVDSSGNVYVAGQRNHRIQKFDTDGNFKDKWEGISSEGEGFWRPTDVDVDPSGNVYVADARWNHIYKLSPDGEVITSWGEFGDSIGQLNGPGGIAVDPSGNVYVCDYRRVQKFSLDGTIRAQYFSWPFGVTTDAAGNVYVAEEGEAQIQKIGFDGSVTKWGSGVVVTGALTAIVTIPFRYLMDVAVDSHGNVYALEGYGIQKFRPVIKIKEGVIPKRTIPRREMKIPAPQIDPRGAIDH